jgi:hypothetical protein
MILCDCSKKSFFLNVIRNFIFVGLFITGVLFSNLCFAKESTIEEEYNAQKKLVKVQSAVDEEDYIRAKLVLSGFQKDFSGTNFYKTYSEKINELAKKIKKMTKNIKVEDKIEYLFAAPRLETKSWKEYMSRAENIILQNQGRIGITVLRVIFEDEDLELPSVKADWNSSNGLNIYSRGGGYSNTGTFQSGGAAFVGSQFQRYGLPDLQKKKDVSIIGEITIGGIYHYPTNVKVEVKKGKAIAYGEVFVRSIPKKYCGNLNVKIETEEGTIPAGARVNLKLRNFYPGITMPLKDNSCLFSSIGPGQYRVGLAHNNIFGSPEQSVEIALGQTEEVTITAYRRRMIEIDWRFRNSNEPNNWFSGQRTMKTDESWQPNEEWPGIHYPVIAFREWTGDTCEIRSSNGRVMRVDSEEPFETMNFPLNYSPFSYDGCPIKEGDVFAWRNDDRRNKGNFFQALVHIKKITPVGLPADQKSSEQEKNPVPFCQNGG